MWDYIWTVFRLYDGEGCFRLGRKFVDKIFTLETSGKSMREGYGVCSCMDLEKI